MNLLSSVESIIANGQARSSKRSSDPFPVVCSTLAPQALSSLIYNYYKIDLVKSCQFWHRGLSDIYLVETLSKPYIFRVCHNHWRSKNEVDFELELLDFLRQRQIPVASPVPTKDGNLLVELMHQKENVMRLYFTTHSEKSP